MKWDDKAMLSLPVKLCNVYFCSGLLNVLDSDQFDSESNFLFKYGDLKDASQVTCSEQV